MENNINNNSQEIDVFELLSKMFKSMGRAISSVFYFLLNKSLWIISFTIIGVMFSVFLKMTYKPVYSSTLIGRVNVLNSNVIMNAFPEFLKNDKKNFSLLFQIPDTITQNICAIEAFYGIDKNRDGIADYVDYDRKGTDAKDTAMKILRSEFYLRVQVLDENIFPLIKEKALTYLLSNPYLLKSDTIRRKALHQRIAAIDIQLSRLDSLQQAEYASKQRENSLKLNNDVMLLGEKNRQLFHGEILALYQERAKIQIELEVHPGPITIMQDFISAFEIKKSLTSYMKTIIPIFILIGLLLALIFQHRKSIFSHISGKSV